MCDPVSIGIASVAMSAIGTGAGFLGQMQQQSAMSQQASIQQANLNYQAQQQRNNATVAQQQADDAIARGKVEEQKRRMLTQQQIGTQTAALAGQGTDLEGSPTDILGDTKATGELDALTIRNNAAREAYGYTMQAYGYNNDATLKTTSAGNSTYSPNYMGAGASLLAGASTVADKWSFYNKSPTQTYGSIDALMRAKGIG